MTKTYDVPSRERYALLGSAFGGTIASRTLMAQTRKGLVRDMIATVTTAFVGTTSVPELRVGSVISDNSFARWIMGSTATAGLALGAYRATVLLAAAAGRTGGKAPQLNDFPNHLMLEGNNGNGAVAVAAQDTITNFCYLPASTAFFITGVAGVGGTPAGTADVYVDIDWF